VGFGQRLIAAVRRVGNPVLVGIDPRVENLPEGLAANFSEDLAGLAESYVAFGKGVVDVVSGLVPAVKFQAAFYEALGPSGLLALSESLAYARSKGLIVILDGKRNDIGSTAEAYAQAYLGEVAIGDRLEAPWTVDALTINAYLGSDGVRPFVDAAAPRSKGLFVLVRTSNPSARELQDLIVDGRPLYHHMADLVATWGSGSRDESGYSLLGAVVGATYPEQLVELREVLPCVIFLVPGYGAQGGTAKDVAAAFDSEGLGAIVNSSRGVSFAFQRKDLKAIYGRDWQRAIEHAAREMIADLAAHTPAGRLTSQAGNPA